MQHQIAVESLKKLSNPRLRPETRRNLIWKVIMDEKICFDLTTYPCFDKFSRRDKTLVIQHMEPYYLYRAMNNCFVRGRDINTIKLMLFFVAKDPITHMYFKYIINGFGNVTTILDNEELKTLFFKLIIKYNIKQAIIVLSWPKNQHKIPDEFKDKILALQIINELSKGVN